MRDDVLTFLSSTPEGIVAEINSKLANFRTYGGLNFEVDGLYIIVRYGKLSTNLKVKCEKDEDVEVFQKTIGANY
jgi:hypothetical protein